MQSVKTVTDLRTGKRARRTVDITPEVYDRYFKLAFRAVWRFRGGWARIERDSKMITIETDEVIATLTNPANDSEAR